MTKETPLQVENNHLEPSPPAPLPSQREIRSRFLLDSLQEYPVILPFALSMIGLTYSLLYAPILGKSNFVLVVTVAAGLFGAASLVWRTVIHYQQGYTRKMKELAGFYEAENLVRLESSLNEKYYSLEQGFNEIQYQEGIKNLCGLENEYLQLQAVLNRGEEADLLSASNLALLVRETYLQGLNVLDHALELKRAIGSTNTIQLQGEIKNLERKLASARQSSANAENLQLIQEKLNFNKDRLNTVLNLQLRVEELLHQANRCEASLNKTHIELAALKADATDVNVTSVIATLQMTIERAKEVQSELRKLGY